MKKILITIFAILITFSVFSQNRTRSIQWLQVEDLTNTRYFIWQGDTIDFNAIKTPLTDIDFVDNYMKFYNSSGIIDSVYFEYSSSIDTFLVEGDSIKLKLADTNAEYLNINFLTSKLDTVTTDNTITGRGTQESPLSINPDIISASMQTVYTLTLPYSSTVAGRVAAATEGTDYPTGWSLAAGSSPIDIDITHGLNRRIAYVSVWAITGTQEQQLFNTAAYNGLITPDSNSLRIQSLATIAKAIKIYIVFAQ